MEKAQKMRKLVCLYQHFRPFVEKINEKILRKT